MAKSKKGARLPIGMVCTICKSRNYVTEKNRIEMKEKLVLKKFCKKCGKQTEHKETQKLK